MEEGNRPIWGMTKAHHRLWPSAHICMMGDEGKGVCPVVSSGVAAGVGVLGMSKPYYGLFLICARWRVGCRSAPYVKPYYVLVKPCYGLVIRGAFRDQLRAGNTPVGSDLALEGRKWVKKARLGWIGPLLSVRAGLEREDARKTPKCGTSMDRWHGDLSVHAQRRGFGIPGLGREGCKKEVNTY